jgi:SAM-dependent methyltransferase
MGLTIQNSLSHFSFRDDVTINYISDWLINNDRSIRILDCGCRDARVAKAIIQAELDLSRICYCGFDSSSDHVRSANVEKTNGCFDGYQEMLIKLRDITDTAGYEFGTFDLILLSNLFHEILVEDIPQMLFELNRLLTPSSGRMIFTDMEELPAEDCEYWSVLWNGSELAKILQAGGFAAGLSKYSKRVRVYRVVNWCEADVDVAGVTNALLEILVEKKDQLRARAIPYRACADASPDSQLVGCRLAAVDIAIHQLKQKGGHEKL